MSTIAFQALDKLRSTVETAIASLVGKVRSLSADAVQVEPFPGMVFVPQRFVPEWYTEMEVSQPTASTQLVQQGEGVLRVEVRIGAKHPAAREALQDSFTNLFQSSTSTPGTLSLSTAALTLQGVATGYAAPFSCELVNWEWNEERVFDVARFTFIEMDMTLPILYLRGATVGTEVYTIEAIQLALTKDLTTTPNATASNLTIVETVQVDADGVLEAPEVFP